MVVPRAIFQAFPFSIWAAGDKIGARMAFKDAFPAAQETYGMGCIVSEGCDPDGREPAILEALRRELIPNLMAQQLLPHMAGEIAKLAKPDAPLLAKAAELDTPA